jgi:type IV secretory pathway VirB2 component (pilin)
MSSTWGKIRLTLASLLAMGIVALPVSAGAVNVLSGPCNNKNATEKPSICKDNQPNQNPLYGPDGVITRATAIFGYIAGVTAVIVLIIAGIRYITSMGDPNATKTARNAILYALIGLVIFASAQLVVNFVLSKL